MNNLQSKFKNVLVAVAPIVFFVLILNQTITPVPSKQIIQFVIGASAITVGLSFLLHGVDLAFIPLGNNMGITLLTSNKLWFVIIVAIIIGFFITFAEPSVQVLSIQISSITGGLMRTGLIRSLIAIGAGVMLSLGMVRIVKGFSMRVLMSAVLLIAFILAYFTPSNMLAIDFDVIGAATGMVTVPFILSLTLGVSAMKKDSKAAKEDSFGLVGITAFGAAFGILIMTLFIRVEDVNGFIDVLHHSEGSLLTPFFIEMPSVAIDSLFTLLPIILMLLVFQKFKFHLEKKTFYKIFTGFIYAYMGLFLFFVGVNAGFMNMGHIVGYGIAILGNRLLIISVGFILGLLIVLTEPAVYVFTRQIENITNGYIRRKTVLLFLAISVAFSVGLSMLRIVIPGIMLWHYLLPGYMAVAVLMFITPKFFVGIGFDSGAVAAGPMTATFVLAFTQGISESVEYSNILADSFGVIAMVTMMPIIALQILGFIYDIKLKRKESRDK
ncbi:MAG: DUF1538 domain-containing protein [Defluviitaleaceae bacterium]|nr:DUF1538 domain-containing protein [Defluviitaleaceae bacterium]